MHMYRSPWTCPGRHAHVPAGRHLHVPVLMHMHRSPCTRNGDNANVPVAMYMYRSPCTCNGDNAHVPVTMYMYRSPCTRAGRHAHVYMRMATAIRRMYRSPATHMYTCAWWPVHVHGDRYTGRHAYVPVAMYMYRSQCTYIPVTTSHVLWPPT